MKLKSVIIDGTKFIIDESKEPIFIESSRCIGIIDHTKGVISIDDSIGETIKESQRQHRENGCYGQCGSEGIFHD